MASASILRLVRDARTGGNPCAAIDHCLALGYPPSRVARAIRPIVVLLERSTYNASGRRRTRAISDAQALREAAELASKARATRQWHRRVADGGQVANAYSRKAYGAVMTECTLTVASPDGRVVVWRNECRANNLAPVTIARACLPECADYFDLRVTDTERNAIAQGWMRNCLDRLFAHGSPGFSRHIGAPSLQELIA